MGAWVRVGSILFIDYITTMAMPEAHTLQSRFCYPGRPAPNLVPFLTVRSATRSDRIVQPAFVVPRVDDVLAHVRWRKVQ